MSGNNSAGTDLSRARTVPLLVHPIEAGVWDVEMALAPSLFPSPLPPEGVPAPADPPTVGTNFGLETGLVAAFAVLLPKPAAEADPPCSLRRQLPAPMHRQHPTRDALK